MKKTFLILAISASGILSSNAQYIDDLYATPTRKSKAEIQKIKETEKEAKAMERKAKEEAKLEQENNYLNKITKNSDNLDNYGDNELVSSIDQALLRRQEAFKTLTTQHDQSYWETMENYYNILAAKYDEDLYNIIAIGDRIWVEPQYITAIFDNTDPTEGITTYANKNAKRYLQQNRQKETPNTQIEVNYYGGYNQPYYNYYGPWGYYSPFSVSMSFGMGFGMNYGVNYGWGYPGYYPSFYPGFYPGYGGYYPGYGGYYPGFHPGYYPGFYPGYYPGGGGYYPGYDSGFYPPSGGKPSRPIYQGHSRNGGRYNGHTPNGRPSYNTTRDKYYQVIKVDNRPNVQHNNNQSNYRPSTGVSNRPSNYTPSVTNKPQVRPSAPSTPAVSRPSTGGSSPAFRPTQGGTRRR